MTDRVAVLGAGGAVGRHVVRSLRALGVHALRVGARDPEPLAEIAREEPGGDVETVPVDLWDDAALARFCAGAAVVVACAGPSYRVRDRVARAAAVAGASSVDPGGDVPVRRRLLDGGLPAGAAVLNAGLMPGLTSILPRWLAAGTDAGASLTAHVGLLDRLTPVSAAEYLLTLAGEHGEPLAAWRGGARASRALVPETGVALPFFPAPVDLQPYLSLEVERLAATLGLDAVDWYNAFDGDGHLLRALGRIQAGAGGAGPDLARDASLLCAAADLDLFGREPYQVVVLHLSGCADGRPVERTLVMRSRDTYRVTAAVAALATHRVLAGLVPPGVHMVEDVLPGEAAVAGLRRLGAVEALETMAGSPSPVVEEGVL